MFWTALGWSAGIVVGIVVGLILLQIGKQAIIGLLTLLLWVLEPIERWAKARKRKKALKNK